MCTTLIKNLFLWFTINIVAFSQHYLQNCVRSRGFCVGTVLTGDSDIGSPFDRVHDILHRFHSDFLQPDDIDVLLRILSGLKEVSVVQKIVQFSAIDLVEANPDCEVLILWLLDFF